MKISEAKLRNLIRNILTEISDVNQAPLTPLPQDTINAILNWSKEKVKEKIDDKVKGFIPDQAASAALSSFGVNSMGKWTAAKTAYTAAGAAGGVTTLSGAGAAATVLLPEILIAITSRELAKAFYEGYQAITAQMEAADPRTKTAFKTAIGQIFAAGVQAGKQSKWWNDEQSKIAFAAYQKFINLQQMNKQEIAAIALVDSHVNDTIFSNAFNKARSAEYVNLTQLEVLIAQYRTMIKNNQFHIMQQASSLMQNAKKQT
jgi:uncharacterized membrane protein